LEEWCFSVLGRVRIFFKRGRKGSFFFKCEESISFIMNRENGGFSIGKSG
jgi:hypothetical protein